MKQSIKTPGVVLALLFLCSSNITFAGPRAGQVVQLAVDAGDWLAAQGQAQPSGTAWPADANRPDAVAYDLGSGTAGIVVYFLSLYAATGNEHFLETAEQGGAYLASLLDDSEYFIAGSRRASLYTGIAGIGVALTLLAEHRPAFSAEVEKVVALLDDWSVSEPAGIRWSDEFNDLLYGDAGTILFLAWRAHRDDDERAMRLAVSASHFLLSQADDAERGHYWRFRRSKPFNLPGFSHGTAGIAYVLGTVGSLAKEPALTDAAADGFAYVDSIAQVSEDRIRIPYGWPAANWEGLYEFGWAHGLVGSDALFTRLQQLGIKTREAARYNALVINTLSNIGLPGTPVEPFAEPSTPLDWRFGRAGVLALLSDYGEGIGTRDAIWRELADRASRDNGMAHWEVDAPAFMGGGRAAFTGVLHGTAGIGLALLRLHAALTGQPPYLAMPDDPFAWSRS
jgi:lantibiotic modifying enzyme